ncbi:carbohydrate kinase family protein [Streptosporangium subroseum]|uniref:carbohydrate kinase family protein n=1 Tax=Streptosporangium subroseum TaxID=106412 RepID=UPI00308D670A|nr:carbohydrate kinase family protein [Streptosporangium subroseum]
MTRKIVVVGAASFYMSVGIEEFPVRYVSTSSPRWLASGVSGAAGHIARILKALGDDVSLCTVVGRDLIGAGITAEFDREGLLGPGVIEGSESSAGVTLVTPDGRRMGFPHLTPVNQVRYPLELFESMACSADLLVLTNAKFVRDLVGPAALLGIPIAVDVHLMADLTDEYNHPWLEAAQIVFCSHERLPDPPELWVSKMFDHYPRCQLVGVGLGGQGAILGTRDGLLIRAEAITPQGVVNTSGAGDALFATFLHVWSSTSDPIRALHAAVVHAGWKIGHRAPVTASLTCEELSVLKISHSPRIIVERWDV